MKRLLIIGLALLILAPITAQAQGFLPACDQTRYKTASGDISAQDYTPDMGQIIEVYKTDDCTLDDFVQLFINLADWGLTIIAVVTVFFFVWGAWDWVLAAGRSGMIDQGKKKMTGALTGVILVMIAWVFIGFIVGALTGNFEGYIFPGSDSQRLWFGNKASCKNTFTIDCRTDAGGTLHDGCGDDATTQFGEIAQLQERLAQHLCNVGKFDGCYGNQTETAVRDFQKANGLTLTGEIDLTTKNLLLAGGNPCGFDPNSAPKVGCCIPVRDNPDPSHKCIQNSPQISCENSLHATAANAGGIEYRFQAGACPSAICSAANTCTYDSSPASFCK